MLVTMNDKEILRLSAIRDVCEKRIRRMDAARILSLSVRQIQRLATRFRQLGAAGISHQRRGKPSPNKINDDTRLKSLKLIHEHYQDFGPTLAHEKLTELHGLHVSVETLRQWMIADGLWVMPNVILVSTCRTTGVIVWALISTAALPDGATSIPHGSLLAL